MRPTKSGLNSYNPSTFARDIKKMVVTGRPKEVSFGLSAEISCLKSYRNVSALSAEMPKEKVRPKEAFSAEICPSHLPISAEISSVPGRKRKFRPKLPLSAEILPFGHFRLSAEIGVSPKSLSAFGRKSFGRSLIVSINPFPMHTQAASTANQ